MVRLPLAVFLFLLAPYTATAQQFPLNFPIRAVAVDSTLNSTVWAAVDGGGLYRSQNGPQWQPVYLKPAGEPQPAIRQILIEPKNDQTMYLAADIVDGGVWKTVDRGATWTLANSGLPKTGGAVETLILLPNAPQTLYAKVGAQVYKTVDGAATWTLRGSMPVNAAAFAVNLSNPQLMYASLVNGIYRSRDEGANWTFAQTLSLAAGTTISAILLDPVDANVIHLAARGPLNSGNGIYRSNDAGERFNLAVNGARPVQLWSDNFSKNLYASTDEGGNIYRSTDRGVTWVRFPVNPAAGVVNLYFDPNDSRILWAGTAVGVFLSTNEGSTWQSRVADGKPTISIPPPLEFSLPPNGTGRLETSIRVLETQAWSIPISVTTSGEGWLTLGGTVVNTPANPRVLVNPQGMTPGNYTANLRISAPQAGNSNVSVPVRLTVLGPKFEGDPYMISTFAGSGLGGNFGDNGPALRAAFRDIDSLALDRDGNLYISDRSNHVIRRVAPNGVVTRFAGNGVAGFAGDGGDALLASLRDPRGIAVDAGGTLYIADSGNGRVRKVTPDGKISTVRDQLGVIRGLAVDGGGNIYTCVTNGHFVGRITAAGQASVFAGIPGEGGFRGDGGPAVQARLAVPADVAADAQGNVYIADTENSRIRRVDKDGIITTVAGVGIPGYQGEGEAATRRALARPSSVAVDAEGRLYIGDAENYRIRTVDLKGAIRSIAGNGTSGFSGDNGPAPAAQIRGPEDIVVDPQGNLYIVDTTAVRVRKLVAPPPPILPQIGDTSLVSFVDESPRVAPGGLFRLRGANLARETVARAEAPWATELGGVRVLFNGRPAALSRVSADEISGQVPWQTEPGGVTLSVVRDEVAGNEVTVQIPISAPAILTESAGRAMAANEDGTVNAPDKPAPADSLLTVFFTGQGLTDNLPVDGALPAGDPPSRPLLPVGVKLGDLDLEVASAQLVPGLVGVAHVQFRVPGGEPGDYPVIVRVGENSSGPAVVALGPAAQ